MTVPVKLVILFITLLSGVSAETLKVHLTVSAPKKWADAIENTLTRKLNAIPEVEVISEEKCADCFYHVSVDINRVTNKEESIEGYSLMALVYGTLDREVLRLFIDKMALDSELKEFLKYASSGNIFLAGSVHTHGSLDGISDAYDEIISTFKKNVLPNYREMNRLLEKIQARKTKTQGSPL
jgi:hypothetical protein